MNLHNVKAALPDYLLNHPETVSSTAARTLLSRLTWSPMKHRGAIRTPNDITQCVSLLNAFPVLREHLSLMADESVDWRICVTHWDALEISLNDGYGEMEHIINMVLGAHYRKLAMNSILERSKHLVS